MSETRNRVAQTTTTTGTGTLTLGSAIAQHAALQAGDDGVAFDWVVLDTDGAAFEVGRAGVYTHSGTTFTRPSGNIERSSNGDALISLSSGTHTLFLMPTAQRFSDLDRERWNNTAGTDADTTMSVNTAYTVDISAWSTANRTYTLPATFAIGDVVDISITGGNTSYELILKPNTGDDVNGGTAGGEYCRLAVEGDRVRFRGHTANTSWLVEVDGRARVVAARVNSESGTAQSINSITWTLLTDTQTFGAEVVDEHSLWDSTNDGFVAPVTGDYLIGGTFGLLDLADQKRLQFAVYLDGTYEVLVARASVSGTQLAIINGTVVVPMTQGERAGIYVYHSDTAARDAYNAAGTKGYQAFWIRRII